LVQIWSIGKFISSTEMIMSTSVPGISSQGLHPMHSSRSSGRCIWTQPSDAPRTLTEAESN